jgi:hypothetical protein
MRVFLHVKAGRLLHFTQRPVDHYARTAASEAAAATASMIFYWVGHRRIRVVPTDITFRANNMTKNLFGAGHGHGEGHFRTTAMYTAMHIARTP